MQNAEARGRRRLGLLLLFLHSAFLILPSSARAHIGDQNVFFEGQAGAYPVRVVVRPPGVIPGLAEISVRVETNGARRVTALPMRWDSGRKGAPPPDEAQLVRGETNLFHAQLWFMRGGAQSVEVAIEGAAGIGKVIVPVNAVATRVLGMPPALGAVLAGFGALLVLLAVSIIGAAVRESVLPIGTSPTTKRRWLARVVAVIAALVISTVLVLGKNWWDLEAGDYRNNRLYKPVEAKAAVRVENGARLLKITRTVEPGKRTGPLVPEHGKLMHLFLVRESGMDVFAHLHPLKLDYKNFETLLPELPAGDYRIYADVTYETGFSETLTATVRLPEPTISTTTASRATDPDDGWKITTPFTAGITTNKQRVVLAPNLYLDFTLDAPLIENRDTRLRFAVRDAILRPVKVEHFMGMGGHLIVRREDGAVFTHLHPGGSFSMAAQQLFELRAEGKAPLAVGSSKGDPICQLPPLATMADAMTHGDLAFPYAFPKPGAYRLWVQVKVRGEIHTGVFDVAVRSRDAK